MRLRIAMVICLCALLSVCPAGEGRAELPASIWRIEESAFEGNVSMKGLLCLNSSTMFVGDRAFAGTGLYALRLPEGCAQLGAGILAETEAAYLYLEGRNTLLTLDSLVGPAFVFAPEGSAAAGAVGRYVPLSKLVEDGAFYYEVVEGGLSLLCPVDSAALDAQEIIPFSIDGQKVISLERLIMPGCGETLLYVPAGLSVPEELNAVSYELPGIEAIAVQGAEELTINTQYSFIVSIAGGGDGLSYQWTFESGGLISEYATDEPVCAFTPIEEGECRVTVRVTDELGVSAEASERFPVGHPEESVKYRALIVGNTYPDEKDELPGPDNDAEAMKAMLARQKATSYSVSVRLNQTADDIRDEIASVFKNADSDDVSLFYYSGHGTLSGQLCGTKHTYVEIAQLKSWLDAVPGTKIVILDSCYSGAFINKSAGGTSGFNDAVIAAFSVKNKTNLATDGYIVMTASNQKQQSITMGSKIQGKYFWYGAFTYYLTAGSGYEMKGKNSGYALMADQNGNNDGKISLGEAYDYAAKRLEISPYTEQIPQYYGDEEYVLWAEK